MDEKKILTPDDPTFFNGDPEEVVKRVNLFLGKVGAKYDHADVQMYEEWEEIKYERPVVDVTEWVNSDEYMGRTGRRTFDMVKDEFFRIMSQEKRPMQLILKGAIGWGKCVEGDTEFYDNISGEMIPIRDGVGKPLEVPSEKEGKISLSSAVAAYSGKKKCMKIILSGSYKIIVSIDHPFRVRDGWKRAEDLTIGDKVGVVRKYPEFKNKKIKESHVKGIAYLLSDGGTTTLTTTFTNMNPEILEEVLELAKEFDKKKREVYEVSHPNSGNAVEVTLPGWLWFRDKYGINGKSKEKRLPSVMWGADRKAVGLFLNRFWACDGSIYTKQPYKIECTLASEKLIIDIQNLLKRFGIIGRVSYVKKRFREKTFDAWRIQIADKPSILCFLKLCGNVLGKEKACLDLWDKVSLGKSNTNWDVVPVKYDDLKGLKGRRRYRCLKHQYYSRDKMKEIAKSFPKFKYNWLAESDLVWEKVEWAEDVGIRDVYDLSVPEAGSWIGNGIVLHNTFLSALIMGRIIYELSCLRSPQAHYGMAYDSNIVLMNLSITKTHAARVLYSTLREMIDGSPYFQEVFPRYMGLQSSLVWPQKHLSFVPGSSSELSPLGENLLGGVIEEANFFPIVIGSRRIQNPDEKEFDAAKHLRDAIWRRMKSRYQVYGRVPGMLILNSSAKYPDDYLENLARQSDPEETTIIEHAEWDTKPKGRYSGEKMYVFIGDSQVLPKIVEKEDELEEYRARGEVMEVPVEYKGDFEKDILGAIRDIAGKNIRAIDRFISDDARIDHMFQLGKDLPKPYHNRFDHGVFCNELDTAIHPMNLLRMEERFLGKEKVTEDRIPVLQYHPEAPRFIHIDLSSTGDATGFCIGHVGEIKEIERRSAQEGDTVEVVQESVPVIYVDALLRILPPEGGEIEFEAIRDLIHRFHYEAGMRYSKITFDQYQSKHAQQLLRKKFGEDVVKPLSVDRTNDAYLALKETIYEKRLYCPFSPPLSVELRQLQISPRTGKVDHVAKGCFTGDTRVSLLDGTEPTFEELAQRYGKDEVFYVYSVNEEGEIVLGRGKNSRRTGVKKVIELILDNYAVVRCTEDHLFLTMDNEYIQAKDLKLDTRLYPLYRGVDQKGGWIGYEKFWQPSVGKSILTHHWVAEQMGIDRKENVIHHDDENKRNNVPENLVDESRSEHVSRHSRKRWKEDKRYADKVRQATSDYAKSEEGREQSRRNISLLHERVRSGRIRVEPWSKGKGLEDDRMRSFIMAGANARRGKSPWNKGKKKPHRSSLQSNHRVIQIKQLGFEEVWDIEVEEHHNFVLNAGVFVHNSKDCADALAGMVFNAVNEFDKGLIDEVQFGEFEDTEELSDEEQMKRKMIAWLLGDPDVKIGKEKKSLGRKRVVLTVSEFDRR